MKSSGWLLAVGLAFLLAGCSNLSAARTTGTNLQAAGDAYLFWTIDARKWVRDQCMAILEDDVTALRADGKYNEARQLLRDSYPPLVTQRIIEVAQKDGAALVGPPGCGPQEGAK